jgi:hypothetical protein
MDTLFGIALVGLWIVISVVALSRAFNSARTSRLASHREGHREPATALG